MTANVELLRAILAMDAYNRGYAAGIKNLGGVGSQIGEATLSTDSALTPITAAGQAAGFYAAAYTVGSQTIISYRGTDFPTSFSPSQFLELTKDIGANHDRHPVAGGNASGNADGTYDKLQRDGFWRTAQTELLARTAFVDACRGSRSATPSASSLAATTG